MSTDDNPSNKQQPPSEGADAEATTPIGAGAGFLPAPTPVETGSAGDAPMAVVTSGVAADDDESDVLEPTQIMPPIAAPPQPGAYGQLGPAPGPHNPDQPWGPGAPEGGYPIPGPPPYGQTPDPGAYGQPPGPGTYGQPPGAGAPGQPYPGAGNVPPYAADPGERTPGGPNRRRLLVAGGVAAALVVVGVGSFAGVRALSSGPDRPGPATGQQTPSAGPSKPPPPPDGGIDSVRTDAKAMTLAEAFPAKSVTAGGKTFTRVRGTVMDGCKDAAKGDFGKTLREADCRRVIGATFVDKHKKYAVTTGIAAMPSKAEATRAEHAADSRKGSWFAPLPGAKDTGADKIGKAGGYAASVAWGRYIVFSYATYGDGHTPGAKDKRLTKISQDFRTTATKPIATRASS